MTWNLHMNESKLQNGHRLSTTHSLHVRLVCDANIWIILVQSSSIMLPLFTTVVYVYHPSDPTVILRCEILTVTTNIQSVLFHRAYSVTATAQHLVYDFSSCKYRSNIRPLSSIHRYAGHFSRSSADVLIMYHDELLAFWITNSNYG